MDGRRVDALARRLATAASRRTLLSGLALGATGLLAARTTGAQGGCGPDQVNRRGLGCVCRATGRTPGPDGCPCPPGGLRCPDVVSGVCVDAATDAANCGGCGEVCASGVCRDGACCLPLGCADVGCGTHDDGCGGVVACGACVDEFGPAGAYEWKVPQGTTGATFDLCGAAGGNAGNAPVSGGVGGLGGRTTATLAVAAGDPYALRVGGLGPIGGAGFNGGGAGGHSDAGGGGGGTDVTLDGTLLLVGGGGGGGGSANIARGGDGGAGGNPGEDGDEGFFGVEGGAGGTVGGGGTGGDGSAGTGEDGSAGQGGAGGGHPLVVGGGGGGGGYYGGGGGGSSSGDGGGGGGGSSYADPAATGAEFVTGACAGEGRIAITYTPDFTGG